MNAKQSISNKRLVIHLVLLCTLGTRFIGAQPPHQGISVTEARQLAYEAIKIHNPGANLTNSSRTTAPEFYLFAATFPNPSGSPIIGYFAVNVRTGDVWNSANCQHLTTKSLALLQRKIRNRFHFGSEEYRKLRAQKPFCGAN